MGEETDEYVGSFAQVACFCYVLYCSLKVRLLVVILSYGVWAARWFSLHQVASLGRNK